MARAEERTHRPLLGIAADVSSRSNAWLLMIRGESNETPCLLVIKLEMFARDQMLLHACL